MQIIEGRYYIFEKKLYIGQVCNMCPRNIHKVREGCDEKAGHVTGMIVEVKPRTKWQKPWTLFECYFTEVPEERDWKHPWSTLKEATPEDVSTYLLQNLIE